MISFAFILFFEFISLIFYLFYYYLLIFTIYKSINVFFFFFVLLRFVFVRFSVAIGRSNIKTDRTATREYT